MVVFGLSKKLVNKFVLGHCDGLERNFSGNKKFSWCENSKIPLSNSIFPFFCPRGHLMGYHLPNVDNHGHLANYHLPNFVHVVIEQPQIGTYPIILHPTVQLRVLNKCTYSELFAYSEV